MADENAAPARPRVWTIPPHRAFADALAAGLLARHRDDPLGLARGVVLVPNRRSARAIGDAFVRRADGGLLLPRLVPIGDEALDEMAGALFDPAADEAPLAPAVAPLDRQLILARLIEEAREAAGRPVDAAEAMRLASDLARTRDQLLIEGVDPARLATCVADELSGHWQRSLDELRLILDRWPAELARLGRIDLAERRDRLLHRAAQRWRSEPPATFVMAAGITTAAPAVAALLRTISRMPAGEVVLPGLDQAMEPAAWEAIGPHEPDPVTGRARPSLETHPQFGLKLLLDRMGVGRGEVRRWRFGGGRDAPAVRTRAINNALVAPAFTGGWQTLKPAHRRLTGVTAGLYAHPAEEAQAIAVALREAIEQPGRTAALITPDRALARRVSAHLRRWGIEADDSAGRPLSLTPPGTLLLAMAETVAERFAPVPLLGLLKHPLVAAGEGRQDWLDGARALDRALRGPRPAPGLDGIAAALSTEPLREREAERDRRLRALGWWQAVAPLLAPLETAGTGLAALLDRFAATMTTLAGDAAWSGPAGRALADLLTAVASAGDPGPRRLAADALTPLLRALLDEVAVRPPQGGHPRVFIWGLIEARLQHADLHVLGGLNEGSWPAAPAPDPWLAPRIRHELGLPGLDRRIGTMAHDFASGLGGGRVLVTRARRAASGPTVASRLWLRLEAMTGGITRAPQLKRWADAIDRPDGFAPASRPAPAPPTGDRPRTIAVTSVDRLQADPFAFYAATMLKLRRWDAVDAEPGPAWRGQQVHAVLEAWLKEDGADPATLAGRVEAMFAAEGTHPLTRALWQPRLAEAIDWIATTMAENKAAGRVPIAAEIRGEVELAGVRLNGTADRIDRLPDGGLAIVDYKTGTPPRTSAVAAGYAMQLGLLGLIAAKGGFEGVEGAPAAFEYWSLAKKKGQFGHVTEPADDKGKGAIPVAEFPARAAEVFRTAAERWLTGNAPFTAKLHPEHAPYADYDQLMRLDEWYGRE